MRTGTGPSAAAVPPSPALVISAVRAPSRAARNAAITPAGPPPMTTTSRLSRLEEAIPASIRAVLVLLPARSRRVGSAALWKVRAAIKSSHARDEAWPWPGDNDAREQDAPMNHTSIDLYFVIDTFLLLLIGVGPKIALVPFVEITAALDTKTKALVVRKMITTAGVVSLLLVGLGELLARLLHFSTGSLSIAGGLILVIIAITMVLGAGEPKESQAIKGRDPLRVATFPLAVPYLLNPAGIVTLVTLSAEADAVGVFAMVVVLLGVVLVLDVAVFRWANRVSDHLDESRMLVTEKVFGILLAALAVQLILDGLHSVGVIHLSPH